MPTQQTTTLTATATIMLLAAGVAMAQSTIRVPGDAPTIQAAIDRAVDGDTVLVAPGRYREALTVEGLAVTLRSEAGPAETILDGTALGDQLIWSTGDLAVQGFTFTGSGSAHEPAVNTGGGTLTIADSVFDGNTSKGLFAVATDVGLRGVAFTNNTSFGNGGALQVLGGSLAIDGATFTGNTGPGLGGAIYLGHTRVDARGIVAQDNGVSEVRPDGSIVFTTLGGGAIYTDSVQGRIDASRFVGNTAAFGGAIYVAGSRTLEITNTLVTGSRTGLGAIYANASAPIIANCTIVDNDDWGLFTTRGGTPTVRNSVFSGNQVEPRSIEIGGPGVADVAFSVVNGDAAATMGPGMVLADPQLDDNFAPLAGSPAIDAGDNAAVPGGITLDLLGVARFVDDPATPDTGAGAAPIVDLGAIEFAGGQAAPCAADLDGDGRLTVLDFLEFQNRFGAGDARADLDGDGALTLFDFLSFQSAFDAGCP